MPFAVPHRWRHHPKNSRVACLAVLSLVLGLGPTQHKALADNPAVHPHQEIHEVVEGAALAAAMDEGFDGVEVRVRPLDQRLRPALCENPLEIVRSHVGRSLGPVTYGVRCTAPTPWTLYLRADVSALIRHPVLKNPLPRGALLSSADLEMRERRITTQAADLIMDAKMAIGMELKRPLPAGSPLKYGAVAPPQLIARGQQVTLVAGQEGLEVRMRGKAMGNGAKGDRLLVTNLSSGRRIEGIVLGDGSVRIP